MTNALCEKCKKAHLSSVFYTGNIFHRQYPDKTGGLIRIEGYYYCKECKEIFTIKVESMKSKRGEE